MSSCFCLVSAFSFHQNCQVIENSWQAAAPAESTGHWRRRSCYSSDISFSENFVPQAWTRCPKHPHSKMQRKKSVLQNGGKRSPPSTSGVSGGFGSDSRLRGQIQKLPSIFLSFLKPGCPSFFFKISVPSRCFRFWCPFLFLFFGECSCYKFFFFRW